MGYFSQAAAAAALNAAPSVTNSVSVGNSALLNTLITVNADVKALTLIPRPGKTIYWNVGGAATANTPLIPSGGIFFSCTKAVADAIRVYCASSELNLDIIQHV